MVSVISYVLISALVLIVLLAVGSWIASRRFEMHVKREINELLTANLGPTDRITEAHLEGLPECVQHWLRASHVVGGEVIHTVRIKQTGKMRTTPEGKWMPFQAINFYNVDRPGFIWYAQVRFAPGLPLVARDKYMNGQGSMLITLAALFPVVNAQGGDEINQSSLLRYLGEMVWFPSAAVSPHIHWQEIDRYSARATLNYQGVTGSGVFKFNDAGEVIEFCANRPRAVGQHFEVTPWSIPLKDYQAFKGIRLPSRGEVIWKLDSEDFNWFQFAVQEVDYNL